MNKKEEQVKNEQIQFEALNSLFGVNVSKESLFRILRRLEHKGQRIALSACNIANYDYETNEANFEEEVKRTFDRLFRNSKRAKELLYINYDPRGFCLKMDDGQNGKTYIWSNILCDWGKNGIFMPY